MAEPFLSEIRIMSVNFPPKGWAFCNGQLLPINQNQALFSLLGPARSDSTAKVSARGSRLLVCASRGRA